VDLVYKYASNGLNNVPLSDWYDASSGKMVGFQARPVVGGHLALVSQSRGLVQHNSDNALAACTLMLDARCPHLK
jgi:hypothetical protein